MTGGRTRHPAAGATPGAEVVKQPDVARLFELTIALIDAGVDIERRVLVPEHYTLADLHLIIQAAMGWTDAHLHEFTAGDGTSYGDPNLDDLDYADESDTLLRDVLHSPGDALRYVYDFGDYWVHRVELAAIHAAEAAAGPACIDGRGACPPEDCGGVSGYRELREVLADPAAPGYEEFAEWAAGMVGLPFDVHAFDVDAANDAVRGLAGGAGHSGPGGHSSGTPERGLGADPGADRSPAIAGSDVLAFGGGSPQRHEPRIVSAADGPAGEARRLLGEALDRIADERGSECADILASYVQNNGTLEPPSVDDLMLWGFYPEDALAVAVADVQHAAALLRGRALTPGAEVPRLAARAAEALAERLREAASRLDAHPVASIQRGLAAICGEAGLGEPALAGLALELEDYYALGGPFESSFAERRDLLLGPPADVIEPPGFSGLDLLVLGDGDRLAFARMAEAVAEHAERRFQPATDPVGVGARSAAALSAELRAFAAAFAAIADDPRSQAWFAVASALQRIHNRAREASAGGSDPSPGALAYANLSLTLAAYYMEGCVPIGEEAVPPPHVRLVVVAALLDPEAIARVRSELAELPADLFTRNVFADLDVRLGDAEAIQRSAGAWGLPPRSGAASGGAHSELCERVAGLLWEITFDPELAEAVEEVTALSAWLATGYEHMALAPPGQSVVAPSPADFERLGWSGAALSRIAGELEHSLPPARSRRAAAEGLPELIARLREAAQRLR